MSTHQWRHPIRRHRYKYRRDNDTRSRLGCLLGQLLPWHSLSPQNNRVFLQDAVELHPLFLLLQEVCNRVLYPYSPRRCAVSPRDQGSLPRSIDSFSGHVDKAWADPRKLIGIGEHGRGIETGPARGSGIISTGTRDTTQDYFCGK